MCETHYERIIDREAGTGTQFAKGLIELYRSSILTGEEAVAVARCVAYRNAIPDISLGAHFRRVLDVLVETPAEMGAK